MNPAFFGASEAPLFGVHHPPKARPERRSGVLLCYPGPEEYMRVHWVYRNLTQALVKAGFHVFRFDYYGTGDSAGPAGEGSLERWADDVRTALQELADSSGVRSVTLVGARLGAALACRVAAGPLPAGLTVDGLALWDPVVSGQAHVEELTALHCRRIANSRYSLERLTSPLEPELLGLPFKARLKRSLAGLDLLAEPLPRAAWSAVVGSELRPSYEALASRLAAAGLSRQAGVTTHLTELVNDPCNWATQEVIDQAILPNRLVQRLAELVAEASP